MAELFNKFFINIVRNLKIPTNRNYDTDFLVTNDQVANSLSKFRNHPSTIMIKSRRETDRCFFLWSSIIRRYIEKKKILDTAKASQQSDVPTKILKQNSDYFAGYYCGNINQCISKLMFPPDLKLADLATVYKNKPKSSKDNYRPVSILSNISRIYERCFYDQNQVFFNSIVSKHQCGFRREYNAQHCLITLIEK